MSRSTITATPTTSAPASRSASTAVSTEPRWCWCPRREHPAALDRRALDPALQAVGLLCLADDERVQPLPGGGGGVQHRRRHRVRAEGQAADRVEVPVGDQGAHHPADDRRGRAVQGHPAQVDVVVRRSPRGQRDLAVYHGQRLDLIDQRGGVVGDRVVHDAHCI